MCFEWKKLGICLQNLSETTLVVLTALHYVSIESGLHMHNRAQSVCISGLLSAWLLEPWSEDGTDRKKHNIHTTDQGGPGESDHIETATKKNIQVTTLATIRVQK